MGMRFFFKSDFLQIQPEIIWEELDLETAKNYVLRKIYEEVNYKKKKLLSHLIRYSEWALPNVSVFVDNSLLSWLPYLEAESDFFKDSIKFIQQFCDGQDNLNSMEIIKKQIENMSDEALEMAYRKKKMQYLIQDAINYTEEFLNEKCEDVEISDVPQEAFEVMAKEFLDRNDCSIPVNVVWNGVIQDYFGDKERIKKTFPDVKQVTTAKAKKGR